jgi:integrase/recombinase XerC
MAHDLIAAYLDHLRHIGRAKRTIDDRHDMLHRMHRELPMGLDLATEEELAAWIYREEWKPASRHAAHAAARSFFAWATRPGAEVLDYDPTVNLPTPRVPKGLPRPPSDEQVARILASPEPWWLWFRLASHMGMRCCEIVAVDRRDITEEDTYVHGKGAKERVVPTDPQVWARVKDRRGRLVTQLTGGRATAHYLSATAATYLDKQGLGDITNHMLRHWYATRALAGGADLRVVQELLGHETPTSTAIYTQVTGRQKRAAVTGLPAFA